MGKVSLTCTVRRIRGKKNIRAAILGLRTWFFWDVTQRRLVFTDVSGHPVGPSWRVKTTCMYSLNTSRSAPEPSHSPLQWTSGTLSCRTAAGVCNWPSHYYYFRGVCVMGVNTWRAGSIVGDKTLTLRWTLARWDHVTSRVFVKTDDRLLRRKRSRRKAVEIQCASTWNSCFLFWKSAGTTAGRLSRGTLFVVFPSPSRHTLGSAWRLSHLFPSISFTFLSRHV